MGATLDMPVCTLKLQHQDTGCIVSVNLGQFDSVADVKRHIQRKHGIPMEGLTFFHDGEELADSVHLVRDPYAVQGMAGDGLNLPKEYTIKVDGDFPEPSIRAKYGLECNKYSD